MGLLIFIACIYLFFLILGSGSGGSYSYGSGYRNKTPYSGTGLSRKGYYKEYLKSDAWKRKRYVVLKRDNWTCQGCGAKATEVHHLKYAKYNIGKEPIHWLVSLCSSCHRKKHIYK